jgi:hypothetical protein
MLENDTSKLIASSLPFEAKGKFEGQILGYLVSEFCRWTNYLATRFVSTSSVGWVLANIKWQTPYHKKCFAV